MQIDRPFDLNILVDYIDASLTNQTEMNDDTPDDIRDDTPDDAPDDTSDRVDT